MATTCADLHSFWRACVGVATAASPAALPDALADEWRALATDLARAQRQLDHPSEEGVAFSFVEGSLVRALREGHWILLDEMNLASAE